MTRPIDQLGVPQTALEAEAERLWAERDRRICALTLRQAADHTQSPSDRIGDSLAAWLVTHPKTPVSTDDDYVGWAEHIAALQATNPRQTARKEASHG